MPAQKKSFSSIWKPMQYLVHYITKKKFHEKNRQKKFRFNFFLPQPSLTDFFVWNKTMFCFVLQRFHIKVFQVLTTLLQYICFSKTCTQETGKSEFSGWVVKKVMCIHKIWFYPYHFIPDEMIRLPNIFHNLDT